MGPRSDGRGQRLKESLFFTLFVLQWGRDLTVADRP